jgi:CHAD domain-containing protein
MAIEVEQVEKPIRKLRKFLKDWPADPSSEAVHKLRTQTRRLEAIIDAFMLEEAPEMRRLVKVMKPVRKAAGAVRDMDVLVADALTLSKEGTTEAVVRLVEHLGGMRMKSAGKLHKVVAGRRKEARRSLKACAKAMATRAGSKKLAAGAALPAKAVGTAMSLAAQLSRWPRLNAGNIHPFRIEVKKLAYILQLAGEGDAKFLDSLKETKDQVGEWHDWLELSAIAKDVLVERQDGATLRLIEETVNKKFKRALATANSLRAKYLSGSPQMSRGGKVQPIRLNEPVVKSTARLVG